MPHTERRCILRSVDRPEMRRVDVPSATPDHWRPERIPSRRTPKPVRVRHTVRCPVDVPELAADALSFYLGQNVPEP